MNQRKLNKLNVMQHQLASSQNNVSDNVNQNYYLFRIHAIWFGIIIVLSSSEGILRCGGKMEDVKEMYNLRSHVTLRSRSFSKDGTYPVIDHAAKRGNGLQ